MQVSPARGASTGNILCHPYVTAKCSMPSPERTFRQTVKSMNQAGDRYTAFPIHEIEGHRDERLEPHLRFGSWSVITAC